MEHVPAVLQVRDVVRALRQRLNAGRGAVGDEAGRGSGRGGEGGQGVEADDAQRVHGSSSRGSAAARRPAQTAARRGWRRGRGGRW